MVDWLSSWLREIILVVLFAVVTDMLLPNNTMQRYIKVVVSLFILLTILSPVLSLIRSDFHFNEVDTAIASWSSAPHTEMATPEQINANAKKLEQVQEQQTIHWVEERLAAMVKDDLIEQGYSVVRDVTATVTLKPNGEASVEQIQVWIQSDRNRSRDHAVSSETRNDKANDEPLDGSFADSLDKDDAQLPTPSMIEPIKSIEQIEPVDVKIDWQNNKPQHQATTAQSSEEVSIEVRRSIRDRIVSEWEVSPEQVNFLSTAR